MAFRLSERRATTYRKCRMPISARVPDGFRARLPIRARSTEKSTRTAALSSETTKLPIGCEAARIAEALPAAEPIARRAGLSKPVEAWRFAFGVCRAGILGIQKNLHKRFARVSPFFAAAGLAVLLTCNGAPRAF